MLSVRLLLGIVCLVPIAAFSQELPPVEVLKVGTPLQGICTLDPCMDVQFRNVSKKEIVGLEFSAAFVDAVGDVHPANGYFTKSGSSWGKSVRPGTKSHAVWSIAGYSNYFHSVSKDVRVKIHKVLFKDGSVWVESTDSAVSSNLEDLGK